jgi:hypothetical protein
MSQNIVLCSPLFSSALQCKGPVRRPEGGEFANQMFAAKNRD